MASARLITSLVRGHTPLVGTGVGMGVRCLSTSSPVNKDAATNAPPTPKTYELRTYSIRRGGWDEFVRMSTEHLHMRFGVSKCNVYLCADPGTDSNLKAWNEVTHIWEYDDLVQRSGVRKQLAGNEQWVATYLKPLLLDGFAGHQSNEIMVPAPWYALRPTSPSNTHFAVRKTQLFPGRTAKWGEIAQAQFGGEAEKAPLGFWITDIGDLDSTYELYAYSNAKDLVEHQQHRDRAMADLEGVLVKNLWWKKYELAPWSQWST